LTLQVTEINAKYDKLAVKYDDLVHTLSSRQIGTSADKFALDKDFPNCRGENFMIKSLAELNIFLNNINLNNKFVSVIAKKSWFQLSQQEQVRIKDDFHKMLNSHPGLLNHIKYLKSHNYYAHRISGNGETERIYFSVINNDNLMVEGIKCCLPLVPKTELNR
jgi:hypothetical protein